MTFQLLRKIYRDFALILLNVIVLFLLSNLILGIFFFIQDTAGSSSRRSLLVKKFLAIFDKQPPHYFREDGVPIDNGKRLLYHFEHFDFRAYEGMASKKHAAEVLDDFYAAHQLGLMYVSWVQHSEYPFSGKRLHIDLDELGFTMRRTINPEIKGPTIRIFTLGGSTTFSYNVSDEHAWPTYLMKSFERRDEYFDWIYLDANHYYDYVKKDLELYFPKVKKGGMITGDDYVEGGWWQGGVKKAVDEFMVTHRIKTSRFRGGQFILLK